MDDDDFAQSILNVIKETITSPDFYLQVLAIALTMAVAWVLARAIRRRLGMLHEDESSEDQVAVSVASDEAAASDVSGGRRTVKESAQFFQQRVGSLTYPLRDLIFPALSAMLLGVDVAIMHEFFDQQWLIQLVQGFNFLTLAYIIATRIATSHAVKYFTLFVMSPLIIIYAVGLLDDLVNVLEHVSFDIGNIDFTLYAAARTIIFGAILFWIGRFSNQTGSDFIRRRETLTGTTKELALKSFQIGLFVLIALMILQVAGIDLTALVVFGGAIGVGLGFGLQQIASNFISGIIILLDRSIAIGDYIELEDGRAGTLRELTMRSATLETYDGKDIMVPNERFITTAFTNWTHNNKKQRYPIVLEVAYGSDLDKLFPLLRDVVSSHPRVLSGEDYPIEERPDAEIQAFNANGIEILIEFWMEDIDDGKNRVGGDLLYMIYQALMENGFVIPFPQREVVIKADHRIG